MTTTPRGRRPRRQVPVPRRAWPTRDILRVAAVVAGVYIAVRLLWTGRSVFLLGFMGVLLGIVLSSGVDRLQRFRVPRGLGAVLLVLGVFGVLTGIGFLAAPQISRQFREVREQVPEVVQEVRAWVQQRVGGVAEVLQPEPSQSDATADAGGQPAQEDEGASSAVQRGLEQQLGGAGAAFFSFFSSTLSVLAGIGVILFVAIFVAAEPDLYHRGLMHLFPHRMRAKAGEVLTATATTLRRWLVMQLIAMVTIGVVTTIVLMLLDVRGAVALGLIAGILEFIPYLGPILSAIPAMAMALVDGPQQVLWVVIAYTAIQQLEGMVIQPLLMKEGLELPPVLTILGQALFSIVFGFMGLFLAVPILASVMVPIKMLYVRDVVGDEVTVPGQEDE